MLHGSIHRALRYLSKMTEENKLRFIEYHLAGQISRNKKRIEKKDDINYNKSINIMRVMDSTLHIEPSLYNGINKNRKNQKITSKYVLGNRTNDIDFAFFRFMIFKSFFSRGTLSRLGLQTSSLAEGNMSFLYRGVSESHYKKTNGKLTPKTSGIFSSYAQAGQQYAQAGSGIVAGLSAANEVVKHEYNQEGLPTSGISTTPYKDRAMFYATHEGKFSSGYIFKINRSLLNKHKIIEYIVSDIVPFPSVPEDDEVILVAQDSVAIPDEIIIAIERFKL